MRERRARRSSDPTGGPDASGWWTLDRIVEELRLLRSTAGHPSYAEIAKRIGRLRAARGVPVAERTPARATVYDCFRSGRRRLDVHLLVDIAQALGEDAAGSARWRQMCAAAQQHADAAMVVTAHADLPTSVGPFVGRSAEFDTVVAATADASIPHVVTIDGMPGSGKSHLAVHVARRLRDSGRVDGVLYVDLRGYHYEAPPADQGAVLEAFLRLLGVRGRELPTDVAERRDLLWRQIGERRYAVILDDATSAEQVLPLLPQSPGSIALITSRLTLDEALLAENANCLRVPLQVFSASDAVELLRCIVGAGRIDADHDSAAELAEASGLLPLAVSVTATRVASKPEWSLADHVGSLIERRRDHRLDDHVRATLDLSYAALSAEARTILRLLAVQPCADLDSAAVSALAGTDATGTLQKLNELARHHLVGVPRPDRYAVHALIRTYGVERSYDDDRPADRTAALQRLGEHYVDHAWRTYSAGNAPGGRVRRTVPGFPAVVAANPDSVPTMDEDAALGWLELNVDNLVTLAGRALDLGRPDLVMQLSEACAWWLNSYGRYTTARLLHHQSLDAARSVDDSIGEALASLDLGQVAVRLSDWDTATELLTWAGTALERNGDLTAAASALNALAIMSAHRGRPAEAVAPLQRCLALARTAGSSQGVSTMLDNLAVVYRRMGQHEQALEHHRLAYEEAALIGDRRLQASGLVNMSDVQLVLGDYDGALRSAQEGLEMAHEINNMVTVGLAMTNVGNIRAAVGDHEQAAREHEGALELVAAMGNRHLEASIHTSAGHAYLALDRPADARRHLDRAHTLAVTIGDVFEQARALDGWAQVHVTEGSPDDAHRCWTEALVIYDQLGSPEASDVRESLTRHGVPAPTA